MVIFSILAFTAPEKHLLAFWIITVLCAVFVLAGIGVFVSSLYKIRKGCGAKKWPVSIATIIKTNIKAIQNEDSTTYALEVLYRYAIDGREFEGTVIHPTYIGQNDIQHAEQLETMLNSNRQVYVYYNPSKPKECTLMTGFFSYSLAAVFAGVLFLCAGIGMFFMFYFAMQGDNTLAMSYFSIELSSLCLGCTLALVGIGFALVFYFGFTGKKDLLNYIRPVNAYRKNKQYPTIERKR